MLGLLGCFFLELVLGAADGLIDLFLVAVLEILIQKYVFVELLVVEVLEHHGAPLELVALILLVLL